jgi:hypothetical protein
MPRSTLDWGTRTAPAECADRGQTKFSVPGSELIFCPRHWRRVIHLERHGMGRFLRLLAILFILVCLVHVCLKSRSCACKIEESRWHIKLQTNGTKCLPVHSTLYTSQRRAWAYLLLLHSSFSFMIISIVILFYVSQYVEEKQIMLCTLVGPWTRMTPLSGTHHICIFYCSSSSKSISTEKWSWVYVTWQT